MGQRHRVGSVALWKKFEYRATGIGCASAIVCVLISLYYNVILSWALYYIGNSFRSGAFILNILITGELSKRAQFYESSL